MEPQAELTKAYATLQAGAGCAKEAEQPIAQAVQRASTAKKGA